MAVNDYELSKELEYVIASCLFENKSQIKRLLCYLVKHAQDESNAAFGQRIVARECLGRAADFDPAENPVVRIEIGRLRKLLDRFYTEEPLRPYKIKIPLGQYRPDIIVAADQQAKYLPELYPAPLNPERLSVLLQFTTEGEDNSELYLLRHQIRIGITIALGRHEAIRLLVAIPDDDGKVADAIDFVMGVSIAAVGAEFVLSSDVKAASSEQTLFVKQHTLQASYESQHIDELLGTLISELFDQDIGLLWSEWASSRVNYQEVGALKVAALVQYQHYLSEESEASMERAFSAIKQAIDHHPGDNVINLALADTYFRIAIHDYQMVDEPVVQGLRHVREALRFSPASEKLHTLHALFTLFHEEKDSVMIPSLIDLNRSDMQYFSCAFHRHALRCLLSDWEGFTALDVLCRRFSRYPKLFSALAYLYYFLHNKPSLITKWRCVVKKQQVINTVHQCVKYMKLPSVLPVKWQRKKLLAAVNHDLGIS
ncbi:MAG: hypothetical protein ACPG47_04990 [Leucothrix sp.]